MPKGNNPVVASLGNRSPHPYTSIALSPNRQYAVVAGKDTLHLLAVGPNGLSLLRSLTISQHFQGVSATGDARTQAGKKYGDVRDHFVRDAFGTKQPPPPPHRSLAHHYANIVVTSVAWSRPQTTTVPPVSSTATTDHPTTTGGSASGAAATGGGVGGEIDDPSLLRDATSTPTNVTTGKGAGSNLNHQGDTTIEDTIIAAAGSNGVVVVWSARQAFFSDSRGSNGGGSSSTSAVANQQPEAILNQHQRSVNSLAWHPRLPGLLLTASQDATIRLWERRDLGPQVEHDQTAKLRSWFDSLASKRTIPDRAYSWFCRATFEPKSEAIRDIQWSKFQDDVFAVVTVSGWLIVYNRHVSARAIAKIAAHAGEATCLDWHPTRPFVIATGGAGDRCVKVWDLEQSTTNLNRKDDSNIGSNSNTLNTVKSEQSQNSYSSSDSGPSSSGGVASNVSSIGSIGGTNQPIGSRTFSVWNQIGSYRQKNSGARTLHVLSISASVTKLRWRPPAMDTFPSSEDDNEQGGAADRHDSMMAVATARLPAAGGSGVLSLWSFNRPFMPLSVVEGHEDGAVTDFIWLDTPHVGPHVGPKKATRNSPKSGISESSIPGTKNEARRLRSSQMLSPNGVDETADVGQQRGTGQNVDSMLFENSKEKERDDDKRIIEAVHLAVWQHVLSVGRDGRCLLQSFARGDRPISAVSPSCFAVANLSPFQQGYGSLQIFSVYQKVPKGPKNQFLLTGLRQDEYTARAPGVFQELPTEEDAGSYEGTDEDAHLYAGKRLPATIPDLVFNVTDQGDLDKNGLPIRRPSRNKGIIIAPEVVHLSRFTKEYKLYPDPINFPTRVDLCLHNGDVAEQLDCGSLARMWRSVASILDGSGLDGLPPASSNPYPVNVMQFVLLPTIKALLEERADAGDVQTCVALCEVFQVIERTTDNQKQTTRIPGLGLNLVREWYLSYIDILQQMCLFSAASFLIQSCNDTFIGALNQQSTTIHESCPRCKKPLQPATNNFGSSISTTERLVCNNCRRRVGLCFLCHEPVKGMFVWCPGCGHGGHLDHALKWFGGLSGKPRDMCPTGCGHRCNLSQTLTSFPRTDSFVCYPTSSSSSSASGMDITSVK